MVKEMEELRVPFYSETEEAEGLDKQISPETAGYITSEEDAAKRKMMLKEREERIANLAEGELTKPFVFDVRIENETTLNTDAQHAVPSASVEVVSKNEAPMDMAFHCMVPAEPTVTSTGNKGELAVKTGGVTAYDIMQQLLKKVYFLLVTGGLYFFDGTVYEPLSDEKAYHLIMRYCRADIMSIGTPSIVKQILQFVKMEPDLVYDNPPPVSHLLAFRNGVLDLRTGCFMPPSPNIFLTSFLNIDYFPNISENCPFFEQYVHTIANGDEGLYARVWEAIGYFLSADMNGKCFLLLYGASDTGKSVFGKFLASFFTSDAIASVDLYKLGERFSLFGLVGKRLNLCLDLPAGKLKSTAVSNLKQLTGGDTLNAEAKYANAFSFENTCKLIFASNHRLILPEKDDAFENRVVLLPFTVTIPKGQQDKHLLEKFEPEKPAIVTKALRYYRQLVARNYQFSGLNTSVVDVEAEFIQSEYDTISEFVRYGCEFADDEKTLTFVLHQAYINFCLGNKYVPCRDQRIFSRILKQICGDRIKAGKWRDNRYGANPMNGYHGIAVV